MENDMTDENRTAETQDLASPATEDSQTTADAAEETQSPEEPVEELPEDTGETVEEPGEPTGEEKDTVQGQTVPFEEDIAPPAEQTSESPEEATAEAVHEGEAVEGQAAIQEENPPAETAEQKEQAALAPEQTPTVESVIEAILFTTDEPLTDSRLASIVETSAKQVRESIESLNAKYEANNNAFRIEQIAGGYQMLTLNIYNSWLKKMLHARSDSKLSPAALETLAIIAYKQPVIRADIEAVRGVAAGEVIRSLMYKGLVKIVGRAEILGHPMLYGTTKKFLEVFGLNSLKDLPKAEELKNPDKGL
jgi:segregation and condensation protein B